MDIQELTKRMHRFVSTQGWYSSDSLRPQTLKNLAISLSLEASEVLEHFQWSETPSASQPLASELADVSLYLLQLASLAGIDLEKAILVKLEQNYLRTWDGQDTPIGTQTAQANKQPPPAIRETSDVEVEGVRTQPDPVSDQASEPRTDHPIERVTVFGGSTPGERDYQQALDLGELLGKAGYTVLTGGYIGTMEAVSRGAAENGGHVIGVTCDEIEAWRAVAPNRWVMEEIRFPTIRERLLALIDNCDAAVALPGGVGTLTEISFMWNLLLTNAIPPRPLIVVGDGWQQTFERFLGSLGGFVPKPHRRWLIFTQDIHQAVSRLAAA
jgi:uncharacterized protein (TIGR00730 family)